MNPTKSYPGNDEEVRKISNKIDTKPSDNRVSADEIKNYLTDPKNRPEQQKAILNALIGKESELRKINGLESAVRSVVEKEITSTDLTKSLEKLLPIQKSLVLLYEGLYGGKNIAGKSVISAAPEGEVASDKVPVTGSEVKTEVKTPELTKDLWDKYTLKRAISTVSGLPTGYVTNLDEISVKQNTANGAATAELKIYSHENGILLSKEVQDNKNINDSQTIIRFEKKIDQKTGASGWEIVKDPTLKDLIILQDGSQVLRLPTSAGIKDYKVALNGTLSLNEYTVGTKDKDLVQKGLGNGVILGKIQPYTINDTKYPGAYYYADVQREQTKGDIKSDKGQKVLFDINGMPIDGQMIGVHADKRTGYFKINTKQTNYTEAPDGLTEKDITKDRTTDGSFSNTDYDKVGEKVKDLITVEKSPLLNNYIVDVVSGEGKIHISYPNASGILQSVLTLKVDELKDNKKRPIYLKSVTVDKDKNPVGGYFLASLDGGVVKINEDTDRSEKVQKLRDTYNNLLERVGYKNNLARYGEIQAGLTISEPQEISPQEDMSFEISKDKKIDENINFIAKIGAGKNGTFENNIGKLYGEIALQGGQVRGIEGKKPDATGFIDSGQVTFVENEQGLVKYKIGMKNKRIHLLTENMSDTEQNTLVKEFINSYKDDTGKAVFEGKALTELKTLDNKVAGYLVNTGTADKPIYIPFDMKANILTTLPTGLNTKDANGQVLVDLTKITLDTSYEVNNKNEKLVGLTGKAAEVRQQQEKRETDLVSGKEKITQAFANSNIVGATIKEIKNTNQEVSGFMADFTFNTKTYKIYFDKNGNVDTTKPVYHLDQKTKSMTASPLKAEIIGGKLVIDTPAVITQAVKNAAVSEKNKTLLKGYQAERNADGVREGKFREDGLVRFERTGEVYEIDVKSSEVKIFVYEKLVSSGDMAKDLIIKQKNYDTQVTTINKNYIVMSGLLKDGKINTSGYADKTLAAALQNAYNDDPAGFTEQTAQVLITSMKDKAIIALPKLTPSEEATLQSSYNAFISDVSNFDNYPINKAKKITDPSSTPKTKVLENKTVSLVVLSTPVVLNILPAVTKDPITNKTIITNAPLITSTKDANDVTPAWKADAEGTIKNPVKLASGGQATVTVSKDGTATIDNPNYDVVKNETGMISIVKKAADPTIEVLLGGINTETASEKNNALKNKIEMNDKLPEFRWATYKNTPPALNFVTEQGQITNKNWFTKEEANEDRRINFSELINFTKNYTGENIAIKELQGLVNNNNASKIIEGVQDRSLDHGCKCKDDNNAFKLNDNKLGINTYAALLCTLQKEGGIELSSSIVGSQRENFKTILSPSVIASIQQSGEAKNLT